MLLPRLPLPAPLLQAVLLPLLPLPAPPLQAALLPRLLPLPAPPLRAVLLPRLPVLLLSHSVLLHSPLPVKLLFHPAVLLPLQRIHLRMLLLLSVQRSPAHWLQQPLRWKSLSRPDFQPVPILQFLPPGSAPSRCTLQGSPHDRPP